MLFQLQQVIVQVSTIVINDATLADFSLSAHAKGIIIGGTFAPTDTAKALSKAQHFNQTSTPVFVRFSDSTGIPQIPDTDANANPRGMAIRFDLGVQNGRRTHTDIITHSTPFFPTRTGAEFLEFLQALGASTAPDAPKPSPVEVFLGGHPSALAFVQAPKPTPTSFATAKYFGVNAFKLISSEGKSTYVRYRLLPDAGESHVSSDEVETKGPNFLIDEIQNRVKDGSVSFQLVAQVADDGDVTDDATVHWPDSRKVVQLGTVKLENLKDDNAELQRTTIFDPVPRVEGVEASDDPLLDMRASIYLISGRERRTAK